MILPFMALYAPPEGGACPGGYRRYKQVFSVGQAPRRPRSVKSSQVKSSILCRPGPRGARGDVNLGGNVGGGIYPLLSGHKEHGGAK